MVCACALACQQTLERVVVCMPASTALPRAARCCCRAAERAAGHSAAVCACVGCGRRTRASFCFWLNKHTQVLFWLVCLSDLLYKSDDIGRILRTRSIVSALVLGARLLPATPEVQTGGCSCILRYEHRGLYLLQLVLFEWCQRRGHFSFVVSAACDLKLGIGREKYFILVRIF